MKTKIVYFCKRKTTSFEEPFFVFEEHTFSERVRFNSHITVEARKKMNISRVKSTNKFNSHSRRQDVF